MKKQIIGEIQAQGEKVLIRTQVEDLYKGFNISEAEIGRKVNNIMAEKFTIDPQLDTDDLIAGLTSSRIIKALIESVSAITLHGMSEGFDETEIESYLIRQVRKAIKITEQQEADREGNEGIIEPEGNTEVDHEVAKHNKQVTVYDCTLLNQANIKLGTIIKGPSELIPGKVYVILRTTEGIEQWQWQPGWEFKGIEETITNTKLFKFQDTLTSPVQKAETIYFTDILLYQSLTYNKIREY